MEEKRKRSMHAFTSAVPSYQLCGCPLTIKDLEAIIGLLNTNDSVTIIGCRRPTSLLELGAELVALTNSQK